MQYIFWPSPLFNLIFQNIFIDLNSADACGEHSTFSSRQIAFLLLFIIRKTYFITYKYSMDKDVVCGV